MQTEVGSSSAVLPGEYWALVLAGGEGSRLQQITIDRGGRPVPKQFCSLTGNRTLLEDTFARARRVVQPERVCTIVSEAHRSWWHGLLQCPSANVFVQPQGKGTGIGILYSALRIAQLDPRARVLVLPSDHYVKRESALSQSLQAALLHLDAAGTPILLGLRPGFADPELGYVVPVQRGASGPVPVARFVEKPDADIARMAIRDEGALWNTFMMVASVSSLIELFRMKFADEEDALQEATAAGEFPSAIEPCPRGLKVLFERLRTVDMSRDLMQAATASLRVFEVPDVGWNDLGTPARLGATLCELPARRRHRSRRDAPFVDLARQYALHARAVEPVAATA